MQQRRLDYRALRRLLESINDILNTHKSDTNGLRSDLYQWAKEARLDLHMILSKAHDPDMEID